MTHGAEVKIQSWFLCLFIWTDQFLLILGLWADVVILILIGIAVYFACKKKKCKKAEGSAIPEEINYENSDVMVEMRSSASEL